MRVLLGATGLLLAAGLTSLWWLARESPETPATAVSAQTSSGIRVPPGKTSGAPEATASVPAVARQATGKISFVRADVGETLELPVAGGAALWDPQESRLRVLLTDDALSAADQRQLLEYLRDERLADSGRRYGLLDLRFRPGTVAPDRSALTSATLTVGNAGDLVRDTADVLSSIQWAGQVQPGPGTGRQLELTSAGNSRSGDAAPRQSWNVSVSVPVVERPQ